MEFIPNPTPTGGGIWRAVYHALGALSTAILILEDIGLKPNADS